MLTQPLQDEAGIASGHALVEIGEGFAQCMQDLRTIEVAERVSGEVAKIGKGPMDILQDTLCVIPWLNAQVFTIFSVPQTR